MPLSALGQAAAAEPGGRWVQIWDGLWDEFLQARQMGLLRPPKRGRLGREEQVDSEVEQRAQLRAVQRHLAACASRLLKMPT